MLAKILIVEDEEYIRRLLIQTIELSFTDIIDNDELEILEANNGKDGTKIAKEEQPELIFSDIMMPKMNGYDVCRIIKEDPDLKDIHIVLLTARGQEIDKVKGLSYGADEYITKPFDPEQVVSKVEEILQIKRTD